MAPKADAAFGVSAILAVVNTWLVSANEWFAQNMPLVSGLCLIASTLAAIWYYRKMNQQRIRDRALEHKRHELEMEKHMHRRRTNAPGDTCND